MDGFPGRTLMREVSETFLLLAASGLTLGGYLGLALLFLKAF
ncbi:MAG: hypothetical protein ACRDIU_06070 [Actinomycetota bacterium]